MSEKRKCIFTGKPANAKLTISSDRHNWVKSVPCDKEWLDSQQPDFEPNELHFRLIELFYEKELARLRTEFLEAKMEDIRSKLASKVERVTIVTARDYKKLVEEIENPSPPTPAFKEAMERYYEDVGLTEEDKEWLNAPMGPTEDLTEEKKPDKIEKKVVKKNGDLWG